MTKTLKISRLYDDPVMNLAVDTIKLKKQAIVFVNTKRSAESQAEKISLKVKINLPKHFEIADKALHALSKPTKQCIRLSTCLKKGIAFHHAGLSPKQRDIIENEFRKSNISIICATATLAYGLDLPAFRVIVRDLKRFGVRGLAPIPILDYHQMSGRAGRPGMEEYGEAITIAKSESEKENIYEKYVIGRPENINSKLAVEPVFRTYVLSLIATEFVNDVSSLMEFFSKTFYAYQFKDMGRVRKLVLKILGLLEEWEFIKYEAFKQDFRSADDLANEKVQATPLGRRVSELYLDPLDAHYMLTQIRKATAKESNKLINEFSFLFMISRTLDIKPLLRVKVAEYDEIEEKHVEFSQYMFEDEPSEYSEEYEVYLDAFKTALFFHEWINEKDEEYLLEKFNIRPGEIHSKLEIGDWLLYSASELSRLLRFKRMINEIVKLRFRLRHGAKAELLPLLKLKNIGRVRARRMFKNNIKDIGDVKKVNIVKLAQLIGKKIAVDVKKQVGQDVSKIKVKERKRKGQISLRDYSSSK